MRDEEAEAGGNGEGGGDVGMPDEGGEDGGAGVDGDERRGFGIERLEESGGGVNGGGEEDVLEVLFGLAGDAALGGGVVANAPEFAFALEGEGGVVQVKALGGQAGDEGGGE